MHVNGRLSATKLSGCPVSEFLCAVSLLQKFGFYTILNYHFVPTKRLLTNAVSLFYYS